MRPWAQKILEDANCMGYEVIVFTASHKCYADTILDYLDPSLSNIQHTLYRDH